VSVIDEILWLLRDGEWHYPKSIIENIALSKFKVRIAIGFLGEYNFIQLNKKARKIKLHPSILEFFKKLQLIEREEKIKSITL
jgi:hypothetical protein